MVVFLVQFFKNGIHRFPPPFIYLVEKQLKKFHHSYDFNKKRRIIITLPIVFLVNQDNRQPLQITSKFLVLKRKMSYLVLVYFEQLIRHDVLQRYSWQSQDLALFQIYLLFLLYQLCRNVQKQMAGLLQEYQHHYPYFNKNAAVITLCMYSHRTTFTRMPYRIIY